MNTNSVISNPILGQSGDSTGVGFFQSSIPSLIGLCLAVGTVIFFFMILWGAVQWITSGGDKQGLESAKSRITNALIGVIIMFSIFAFMKLLQGFFHVTIMQLDIGPLVIR